MLACEDRLTGEDACLGLILPSRKFPLVSGSFSLCQGQTHPNRFIPLELRPNQLVQLALCGGEVDFIQSDSGSWSQWTGLVFSLYFLFRDGKGKEKTKHRKINFLSVLPSSLSPPASLTSLHFTLSVRE